MKLMGLGRVELPTSRLSGVRSNHLSYRPSSRELKPCDAEFCKLAGPVNTVNRRRLERQLERRASHLRALWHRAFAKVAFDTPDAPRWRATPRNTRVCACVPTVRCRSPKLRTERNGYSRSSRVETTTTAPCPCAGSRPNNRMCVLSRRTGNPSLCFL